MSDSNKNQDLYRQLFERSADAHLIIKGGRFVDCNQVTIDMLGYTKKQELLETHPSELSPPTQPDGRDSVEKADEMMAITLENGNHQFEWAHVRSDGEIFPVLVSLTALNTDDGIPTIHTIWRDISKRKDSERRYKALFENSQDAICILDAEGNYRDLNAAAISMLGYSEEELLAMNVRDCVVEEDKQKSARYLKKLQTDGFYRGYEGRIRRKSGEVHYIEVNSIARYKGGEFNGSYDIIRNVTDRKKAELSLRESEERYRSLFENMNDGFALHEMVRDESGKATDYIFLEVNKAFEVQTGLRREDLIGRRVTEALPGTEDDEADWIGKYGHVALTGEELRFEQYSAALDRWFTVMAFSPKPGFFATIVVDITERHRWLALQESLSKLSADLLAPLDTVSLGRVAAGYIRDYFRSDAISIWYHDHDLEQTHSVYLEDTPEDEEKPREFEPEILKFDESDRDDIFGAPSAYVENRTQADLEAQHMVQPFGSKSRMSASILFSPIVWESKKIGVISVHSYTLNAYQDEDLRHLKTFADLIGVALQRVLTDIQLKDKQEELTRSLSEKQVLLREIQHRTKNNMNIIIALLRMQEQELASPELSDAFEVTQDRIHAMSLVYDQLQRSENLSAIDLAVYLDSLVKGLHRSLLSSSERISFEIECDSIPITLIQAVPIGILLNEIVTNALKHAFPDEREGKISLKVRLEGDELSINISDDGVGISSEDLEAKQESLGLRLVSMLAVDQLSGSYEMGTNGGVSHRLTFQLVKPVGDLS